MRPVIGIIMRNSLSESGKPIGIAYHSLFKAIDKSGGKAIAIINNNIEDYLDICEGFILQGGDDFDKENFKIIKILRENNIPTLGICLGMQEMAYIYKGLMKDIPGHKGTTHKINIEKDSLLYKILKKKSIKVNSSHKSIIMKTDLYVSSYSENDHMIESVEDRNNKFFLGVQWHPESIYDSDIYAKKIFDYFIDVCKK